MSQHLFIAPADIQSPRWRQAFPTAFFAHDATLLTHADCVWLLVHNDDDMHALQTIAASGRKIIAMTQIESGEQARSVLESGASGYVHYLAAASVLEQVAQVVAAGGMWLGADLMRQLVLATARSLPAAKPVNGKPVDLSQLTSRELAVAERVAAGKTNKEVARELDITERTVKAHLGSAFEKLNVRDRLHLVLVMSGRAVT
ncbi:response regulator transcription factor [Cellvibrio sp. UBA7661]|uniref:response regulator transcription factor n=1 Tax=Cellvibrio sp. UBA7661 TaxID=1946311 RepID=UPI002F354863